MTYRPIKGDPRYTISREWVGCEKPCFVVRFCDDWVAASARLTHAIKRALLEDKKRKIALGIEKPVEEE
jgi:hypothetical protein